MKKDNAGIGRFAIFALAVLILIVLVLVVKLASTAAPAIRIEGQVKGIGQSTLVKLEVSDAKHNIRAVDVRVIQNGRAFSVPVSGFATVPQRGAWWKLWASRPPSVWTVTTHIGRKQIPDLAEGRATLQFVARNDSWGRFFRGGRSQVSLDLPVRFLPPRVDVLTTQHYINQGGCDMVLFKVSPGTTESGVEVGSYFFPSWPVKDSMPETRLCLFAYPYNLDPKTPARIVARDDAGNESLSSFTYQVFPKKFHTDTINVTDEFMQRVVPPIMSQTADLEDQGSLLKNFLLANGHLREVEAKQLIGFSKKTASHFLWTQPFVQLSNSKVEASFADYRAYMYNGQVVDHQTHLGYDLAVTARTPVLAANDGVVVYASWFGIYGNAVILDHGCGLQTLYGHLSSIDVKEGESVKREQVIGHSGQTGLAGGDHLHFAVLLDGIPVSTIEWWDPHWIHDRIEAKLAAYQ
ncbi:MAG TPA: M23 family metallopeptidase [Terriglobia bacterium]|nr:M23 family metallopeptidase [Terriglobia bacterium]